MAPNKEPIVLPLREFDPEFPNLSFFNHEGKFYLIDIDGGEVSIHEGRPRPGDI